MNHPAPLELAQLPEGDGPEPIALDHSPSRLHAFIFRNWHAVDPARIARILRTDVHSVTEVATSMGLGMPMPFEARHADRGYLTVLRRNWHLLPYGQLLELLDMTATQLDRMLREDDFLWYKLGFVKPRCPPLHYAAPTPEDRMGAERAQRLLGDLFTRDNIPPHVVRYQFIDHFTTAHTPQSPTPDKKFETESLRIIYSYAAMFGDPLADPALDPYPEGLLQRLSALGVNGVWMHVVLREMAPGGDTFPEFGEGHEKRLAVLATLAERAARHGIGIYLYMNEPRAMPSSFFKGREHLAGVSERDLVTMCTSCPEV